MSFKVKHFLDIPKEQWDKFVYSNSMGWAYYLYDVISIHRNSSYKNISFAILNDKDEILFVIQLHLASRKRLISQWGFCLKDDLPPKQLKKLQKFFEDYIDFYIKEHKIKSFEIAFPPLTKSNEPLAHNLINPAMFFGFKPEIRYTYVVDLSKPDDRMLADCEETTRQAIRKTEASGKYSIVESNGSEDDCKKYIKLHKETYTRTGAADSIIADSYHEHIFKKLIPSGRTKVFFLKDNATEEYIATVMILLYKNTAYYWWGCSKNDKDIGINKYLLFKSICTIRESFGKTGYFETGGAYPFLRSGKYKGLNDFKKCFGTFLHPIYKGTYLIEVKRKQINILGIKIKHKSYVKPKEEFIYNSKAKYWTIVEGRSESNIHICKKDKTV